MQTPGLSLYATGDNISQGYNQLNDLADEESNDCDSFQSQSYNLRNKKHRYKPFLRRKYSDNSGKKFTRKQVLCIFFCVLIIGGAILIPMITPFFYLLGNVGEQSNMPADGHENIFGNAVVRVPPIQDLVSYSDHLINLDPISSSFISDAVCRNGVVDMCCIVRNNGLLRCCHRGLCHNILFSAAPENSYLIDDKKILLMESDQEIRAYTPKKQTFKLYESLVKLNEHCKRGLLGEIAKQEASKNFINLLNKIKDQMPGLKMREIALGYFCEDGSLIRISHDIPEKEHLIKLDLRNTEGELFAVSYSRRVSSNECKIGSDCALAVIGIDYSKLAKVRLSDDDIERILSHEMSHLIQRKQMFLEDYSNSNCAQYIRDNIEIDADLKSQLAVDSNDSNFDMAEALIKIDHLLSNSFGESFRIDSAFNCFELMNQVGNIRFTLHPDNRCRVAFVLSLSEAMEKMNYFFKQRIERF